MPGLSRPHAERFSNLNVVDGQGQMDAAQRSLVAAIVQNVIAPGNRAILPNAVAAAVEAYAQDCTVALKSGEDRLGRFWDGEASGLTETDIRERIDVLQAVGRDITRAYGAEGTANIPYGGLQTLYYLQRSERAGLLLG